MMKVSTNKVLIISSAIYPVMVVFVSSAHGLEPLIPHEIKDMLLVGQEGDSNSWDVRGMTLVGNYLYCSGGPSLQTIDVSDPTNLVLTDDWDGTSTKMNGSAVKGNVLYVSNWTPSIGLRLFNIDADPAHPALIKTISTTANTWDIEIFDNLMYVTINNGLDPPSGINGINVYDITNPIDPILLTHIDPDGRTVGNAVQYGDYLYFTSKWWLNVYKVSNPSSPTFVRRFQYLACLGICRVKDGYLYMVGLNDAAFGYEGGLYSFSLADPSNPQLVDYLDFARPRNIHFQDHYCIVSHGSTGNYTINTVDPANMDIISHWNVSWPGTGENGISLHAKGIGAYVFIGCCTEVTDTCSNFDCPDFGARVYSVEAFSLVPPIIAKVTPDPDSAYIGQEYSEQLILTQGNPAETDFSVVQGPTGMQVDNNGLVNGWVPGPDDIGNLFTLEIKAIHYDGQDTEQWQVRVKSRADFDYDYDVDQEDFGLFQTCYSGSGEFPTTECEPADLDSDRDVDVEDFGIFQTCMGGPSNPPGC
ncbi:MAG: hypothetical protein JSV03_09310 [Planctomycetota bacterium]|nr:MAG: hypothetical protein JSV03_09310 [Planctomycetota bacterium]